MLAADVPTAVGMALFSLAALLTWRELRRPRPARLRWLGDGSLMIDWPDGREASARLLGHRRIAALTVIRLHVGNRTHWLDLWPDALDDDGRKALRRRLQSGQVSAASV